MDLDNNQVKQVAHGTGISQALGKYSTAITIFGIPLKKILMVILLGMIVFQCPSYACGLMVTDPNFSLPFFGCCFPLFCGLPSFFSIIFGIVLRDVKISVMGVISGILSLVGLFLMIMVSLISNAF